MLEADVFSDKPADYPANIPETKLIKVSLCSTRQYFETVSIIVVKTLF